MTSKKKRIHELAKDLGLSAQDLVAKLQSYGFVEVKGPQTALDESTLLRVQGMLEVYGIVGKPAAPEATTSTQGGLTLRKKKKRTSVDGGSEPGDASADAAGEATGEAAVDRSSEADSAGTVELPPTPAPRTPRMPEPALGASRPAAERVAEGPTTLGEDVSRVETAAPRTETPAHRGSAPTAAPASPTSPDHGVLSPAARIHPGQGAVAGAAASTGAASAVPTAPAPATEPLSRDVEPEVPSDVAALADGGDSAQVVEVADPALSPGPTGGVGGAGADGGGLEAAARRSDVVRDDLVKPASQRRPGKVVGFVDLSKVQAQARPQAQARKLRSKDDIAPNVQPTFGNDRKKALVRGDHAQRGSLTASQLREKESSRFLRRRGANVGPGAPRPGAPGRGPSTPVGESPVAGGEITIDAPITVKKLADALSIKAGQILGRALTGSYNLGALNINSVLDDDAAGLLALDFGVTLKIAQELEAETLLRERLVQARGQIDDSDLDVRPPTIAFLGHVDHGKTTLLDKIRDSRVAHGESGGITQHIGAYQIATKSGKRITILDTPGHEAFTAMRARGARAVDIVVLVVAADDGVMPSTVEAIAHAKAAKTPVVVALNKCDKPQANPSRVEQQLAGHELLSESYGGQVGMVKVSATQGTGIDELLDRVVLEAEQLELKSHTAGPASGVVLEAEVQEGKGRVAFLLVKEGTLSQGDVILAGEGYGKVRSIHDDRARAIKSAGPSAPVEVSGLSELPGVGDPFHVVSTLEEARAVAEERARKNRMMSLAERRAVTADSLDKALSDQQKKAIHVILKADVQGSLEALKSQIESLTHDEVDVRLLHSALGTVTESDVNLAASSGALVLAFHVGVNEKARSAAERSGVEIRPYEIIYEMLDDLRGLMEGTLAPEISEQVTGHVEVRALFKSSKFGSVAGSHVIDGSITRDAKVRVLRGKTVLHTGTIAGLRREKDEVKEVREGFDCGVTLKDFDAYEVGDVIEAFKMVTTKRLLKI